jgi:3'(2'),5'-bisphosphate nucleotidase
VPPQSTNAAASDAREPLNLMLEAASAAGTIIAQIYATPFSAEQKADGSPVTEADRLAEAEILRRLAPTGLPVLAEESVSAGRIPELGRRFFVVDPLDGTKEFLKRNGEFTVNIALVEDGRPILGVVLAPASGAMFSGGPDGAFEYSWTDGALGDPRPIAVAPAAAPPRVVASRSHGDGKLTPLLGSLGVAAPRILGSSLKFCIVARGEADLYPRFTPTSEWDTAAGQAVLEAAGGVVVTHDGAPLRCGEDANGFINPGFIAAASPGLAARTIAAVRNLNGR